MSVWRGGEGEERGRKGRRGLAATSGFVRSKATNADWVMRSTLNHWILLRCEQYELQYGCEQYELRTVQAAKLLRVGQG